MTDLRSARRLAAILVMDAVGYSRRMAADEPATLAALNRCRRMVVEPGIAAFDGRIVKGTGDGFLAEFASVVNAVRCAVALQQGLVALAGEALAFRMAVNIGDIIVQDGDIFGDGVNVAARLEALAEPGGLCVSSAARDQLGNRGSFAFTPLGPQLVKNIATPVEAFALSSAAIATLSPVEPQQRQTTHRRYLLGGMAAIAVATALAALWHWFAAPGGPDPAAQLTSLLATELPNTSAAARQHLVKDYFAAAPHRAMLLAPKAQSRWWSADWPSPELALEKGLERCQVFYREPCAVLAIDDAVQYRPANGEWPVRDMPRASYSGSFDPAQIPGFRLNDLARPDITGYAAAPGPKAAAYNVHGILAVVSKVGSQHQAEADALALCNADPSRRDADGPCLLYAQGNKVVLGERYTAPATP